MKKETILSLVLVILILGSVVGMALGTRSNTQPTDTPDQNVQEIPTEGYSGNANSIISQVYPELIVASKTTVFDTNQIQSDFININGIKKITVEFNKLQDENIIVIVRAVIDEAQQQEIVDSIKNLTYLTSSPIEFYKQATIDLNGKIMFTSVSDENKTIDYEFIDQRVSAIVGLETQKDDNVSGQIQALFRGEKPDSLIFYESTNKSATPQMVIGAVTLNLLDWKEEYLLKGEGSIENQISKETILSDLNIEKEATIDVGNKLIYKDINTVDFNSENIDNNNISNITISDGNINVTLKDSITFEEYTEVLNLLEDNNLSKENILEEPKVNYYIILEKEPTTEMITTLNNLNISILETNKKGNFDISTIEIEGNTYNYPDQNYGAWLLYPEDLNKTSFDFTAQAYVSRKEIMFINLVETKKE